MLNMFTEGLKHNFNQFTLCFGRFVLQKYVRVLSAHSLFQSPFMCDCELSKQKAVDYPILYANIYH